MSNNSYALEDTQISCQKTCCPGQASAYGSTYSTAISMVTWGVIFFVGIALLVYLIQPSGSSGGGHNNGH